MTESPSASQTTTPPTRIASSPFNKPEADIVLRSVDGVDFCVRSHILVEASPVFESILSIPQPSSDHRPIVDLTEDQKTLDIILRICYPIVKVKSSSPQLEEVECPVKAALKYEMELPLSALTDELLERAKTSPLEVWATGCRTGQERVARHAAAEAILSVAPGGSLVVPVGHLNGVSSGDYFRLLEFHRMGGKVGDDFRLLTPTSIQASTEESASTASAHTPLLLDVPYPDLVCISSDGVNISVPKAFVAAASPVLREQIEKASTLNPADPPILRFDEDARLLGPLLNLCHPGGTASDVPSRPSEFVNIIVALDKYEMASIRSAVLTQRWEEIANASPIRAYLAAAHARLRDCAEVAAKYTLRVPLEGRYVADMEHSSAVAYHHLLAYHASCRAVARQSVRDSVVFNAISKDEACSDSSARAGIHYAAEAVAVSLYSDTRTSVQKSQDDWLESFVGELATKADAQPSNPRLFPTAFEAAVMAGKWCGDCSTFAVKLFAVNAAVQSIRSRIVQVTLVF